jgi:dCMP deaminase
VNRVSRDVYYLEMARTTTLRSTCSRLQVGAVLVRDDEVIGAGYNGAPKGVKHCVHVDDSPCRVSVHAEANALIHARKSTTGSVLYVTHAPCFECAKLIINARVDHVVFAEYYRSLEGLDILSQGGVPYTHLEH